MTGPGPRRQDSEAHSPRLPWWQEPPSLKSCELCQASWPLGCPSTAHPALGVAFLCSSLLGCCMRPFRRRLEHHLGAGGGGGGFWMNRNRHPVMLPI